jgi:hypothetical protein
MHARTLLGTDLVMRFVTEYYQERVYGGGGGLSNADAEQLVAALEALPIRRAATTTPSHAAASNSALAPRVPSASTTQPTMRIATDLDEAVPTGLEEFLAQEMRELAALEREAEEMRRQLEIAEAVEQQRVAAEAAELRRLAADEDARLKQQTIEKQEREEQAREIAAAKKATATIAATKETDRKRNDLKVYAPSRANEEKPPRAEVKTSNPTPVSEMRKVQASPARRLTNVRPDSEQDRWSDRGAELTDAQARISGTVFLLVGALLFYATVYLPYESAKNHEPVRLNPGPFWAPVFTIMGALMALFGQRASKWLGRFSVLFVIVCSAAGLWCDHWLKSVISNYGSK